MYVLLYTKRSSTLCYSTLRIRKETYQVCTSAHSRTEIIVFPVYEMSRRVLVHCVTLQRMSLYDQKLSAWVYHENIYMEIIATVCHLNTLQYTSRLHKLLVAGLGKVKRRTI